MVVEIVESEDEQLALLLAEIQDQEEKAETLWLEALERTKVVDSITGNGVNRE